MIRVVENNVLNVLRQLNLSQKAHWASTALSLVVKQVYALDEPPIAHTAMVVAAGHVLATLNLIARLHLVQEGVVDLLLPAVTHTAECLERAPLVIVADKSAYFPVGANVGGVVVEEVGFAAEVLPVVRILALGFIVRLALEGAPLRLKVVHIEVG
eukprot:CAMPEP_0185585284 /NCGR_PEP_ID=MMETSP0434-20130131/37813_1 /TAXON_ID=626734 ORGANISM="Favella taraikaensis, Strain Fe Narragansett Bay" /NCGR_SAMPLE_ID=MMETSP0434 /ASSEMBLY_ACC=CAM_ASM_000379 /LENGTH=155 /DNA_ID=CAMNT_0028205527 /DNA_START=531 /DNA_END=995 /DNA_ORIENTATION=-